MTARVAVVALAFAACVPSTRSVRAPVDALVRERVGVAPAASVSSRDPLTREAAIAIALASPRAQAARASLGVAAGELGERRGLGHTEVEGWVGPDAIDVSVVHDISGLVVAAPRRAAGEAIVAAAQARATATLIALASTAELAWLDVAAAIAQQRLARDAYDTLDAAADLTTRIRAAGGTTALAAARADSARELARLDVARTELALERARTALDAALGVSGEATRWRLSGELPALAGAPPALDDLERDAVAHSLMLAALTADGDAAANDARVAAVGAWLPGVAVGVVAGREGDSGWSWAPAVQLELPLVTGARGTAAKARAKVAVSAAELTAAAVELRVAARAARLELMGADGEARHLADVVVPLTRLVVDETVLQYNAMNASPFELLSARRDQAVAEQALLAARLRRARAEVIVAALRHGVALSFAAPTPSIAAPTARDDH